MRCRMLILLLACSLLLGGCGWLDGSYVSVKPHQGQSGGIRTDNLTVSDYQELLTVLEEVVAKGTESCVINVVGYEQDALEENLESAARHIQKIYPVGAYAVEEMSYEIGSNVGKIAIALDISYRHSRTEIRKIHHADNMEDVRSLVGQALEDYDPVLVLQIEPYEQADYAQIVENYAQRNPQKVMETPQVTAEIYGIGHSRVVELTFSYQTSREALRLMQAQVQPVFESAVLYVSGEGAQMQKYSQLYAFLMERFDYTVETSITPAYSLLRHGVGDSRAFATVYAAMCRDAGLECMVVTGTHSGEPRIWNMICAEEMYYHVDLLRSNAQSGFEALLDEEMTGYVWDYSAYPQTEKKQEEIISSENEN